MKSEERAKELARTNEQLRNEITERERAEGSLRESEERFRKLSEATFEAIIIHEEGRVLEINQVYAEMFGYEPSELVGKNVLRVVLAPESRQAVAKHIRLRSEEPYEAIGLKKDGTTFPVEVRAKPISYQGALPELLPYVTSRIARGWSNSGKSIFRPSPTTCAHH